MTLTLRLTAQPDLSVLAMERAARFAASRGVDLEFFTCRCHRGQVEASGDPTALVGVCAILATTAILPPPHVCKGVPVMGWAGVRGVA